MPTVDELKQMCEQLFTKKELSDLRKIYRRESESRSPNDALVAYLTPLDKRLQAEAPKYGTDGFVLSWLAYVLELVFSKEKPDSRQMQRGSNPI